MTALALLIPPLGTHLELAAPWQFWLHAEKRNLTLFQALGEAPKPMGWYHDWGDRLLNPLQVELPAGTVLTLDRIYIRQGGEDFDSVTFRMKPGPGPLSPMSPPGFRKNIRFWVKLEDANRIQAVQCAALAPKPLQVREFVTNQEVLDLAAALSLPEYRVQDAVRKHGSLSAAEQALLS